MDIKVYYDNKEFTQAEYNTYILYKYLTKHYDKDIARKVIENSKDLNIVAKALGKEDIAFFCLYFLQDIFVVKDNNEARNLSPTHYEIWDLFNVTFVKDKIDKINIICPRGMAKTTMGTLALTVWLVCYQLSQFTLIGAKKDSDAQQFIDSIKKVFQENEKIIDNFGKLIDKKKKNNANEVEFSNGMYIRAVGSASSVRGANFKGIRPTVVIADDYQDERDILTEDAREKKYNKWTKEIENVGDTAVYRNGKKVKSATKIVSIGTVLHSSCLISQIARNKDYYTLYKQAVILEEGQTIEDIFETDKWLECKNIYFDDKIDNPKIDAKQFYEEHKDDMKFPILWEEKWDCFDDIAVPYWENREAFMSEKMNDSSSIMEKWIRSNRTQSKEDVENHNFNKTMLCVDPAGIKNKRKGDYFAFVVVSLADNEFKYVRKGEILRFSTFSQYIQHIIDILHEFDDITHVYIEKNTYMGLDADKLKDSIVQDEKLKDRDIEIINKMEHRNKDEKISTITDDVNNGRIIFCEERVMKEAIEQMMEFQGEKYTQNDDFIDCLAIGAIEIDNIEEYGELQIYDIRKLGL
ncbi:terminase [Anaerosalibacter bizertensis]|uniref:Terminase n=1 Tax=Anaerosalibacter bizertensis TaxID=932217 RepID=A0A844FIJ5_9FIRM|nr:terminase [Anaerosalibacter bizertensis]MSS43781.1 terminase [Anaerosalibacter bizertensis]